MRRIVLLPLAGLLTVAFLLAGCYLLVDLLALEHRTDTLRFDPAETVATVDLRLDGGGVVRVVGDASPEEGLVVDFRWKEGLQSATYGAEVLDGALVVRTGCPKFFNAFCTVSATVHVAPGTTVTGRGDASVEVIDVGGEVDLALANGSARVEGAQGDVQVTGDNGEITVVGGIGDLDLRTSNGSIRTEGVRSEQIQASSDNGSLHLDLAAPAARIVADSDNGNVTVLLPPDAPDYATQLSTDNGSIDDPIRTDPGAERLIVASTDNGSISLRYRR